MRPDCRRPMLSPNGLELTEHRWNEFRDRRVDRHGTLKHRVEGTGIHDVDDAVYCLITARAEDCRPQDPPGLRVDGNLHETLRLALLDRPSNTAHRALRAEQRPAAGAGLFGYKIGIVAPVVMLAMHLIYGVVLGTTYGLLAVWVPAKDPKASPQV